MSCLYINLLLLHSPYMIPTNNLVKYKREPKLPKNTAVGYAEYDKLKCDLSTYKNVELKALAKYNKMSQTGSKRILIGKLQTYYSRNIHALSIQTFMRGYYVRKALNKTLRGKAFMERTLCINECDFYTMDPLATIPFQQFFSYTDEDQFTYGFDIHSLVTLFRQRGEIYNPYNRAPMGNDTLRRMLVLYLMIKIVFPEHVLENDKNAQIPRRVRRQRMRTLPRSNSTTTTNLENTVTTVSAVQLPRFQMNRYQLTSVAIHSARQDQEEVSNVIMQMVSRSQLMNEMRQKPTQTRIQELFMEIDQLGNYTDSEWMLGLLVQPLQLLYRNLLDIWRYRAQIPYEVKHRICPVEDPFDGLGGLVGNENELDYWRRLCLGAMENMVYSALDIEYRRLGAMHVLSALTVVSLPARTTFLWLYESMF
jgi:hypothetical protein